MSTNLNKCADQLVKLAKAKPRFRDFLLLNLSKALSQAVIEIVKNFLKGRVNIPSDVLKTLKRYKGFFRKIDRLKSWRGLKKLLKSIVNRRALHKVIVCTCDSLLCSESGDGDESDTESLTMEEEPCHQPLDTEGVIESEPGVNESDPLSAESQPLLASEPQPSLAEAQASSE